MLEVVPGDLRAVFFVLGVGSPSIRGIPQGVPRGASKRHSDPSFPETLIAGHTLRRAIA